jgi:putative component of toxin-antitoxin plasmid stabilization module
MIEVFRYQIANNHEPVTEWLQSLRDKRAQAKVRIRLKRIEAGILVIANRWVTVSWN